MPTIKPQLSEDTVRSLLTERFAAPQGGLLPISIGMVAQTFAFSAGGRDYIIRLNRDNMTVNLEKDAYIYQHFASPTLPIPTVYQVGRAPGLVYAITQKIPGHNIMTFPTSQYAACIPSLIETLDAIHACDVSDTAGYGLFDGNGVGLARSWRDALARVLDEDDPSDFYGNWHHLFADSFLERDVFDRIYAAMVSLLDFCPEQRWLIHGDYGFGNVLVQDGQVTAVLDWLEARYGDFLYDVAYLDYGEPDFGFADRFAQHYAVQGRKVPNYSERLRCYQCYMALDEMRFFAQAGRHDYYLKAKSRILALLGYELATELKGITRYVAE